MAGERSYIRVPPDSTGKKIRHEPFHRVGYNNRVGNHIWQVGKIYEIGGYSGTVFNGPDSNAGYLGFKMISSADFQNVDLTAGMDIMYNGVVVASATSDEIVHIPYAQISGGDNPNNTVNVDATGAMNVRFGEGRPQLDAFGKLRTSGASILGDYTFSNGYLPDQFATIIDGKAHGAKVVHNDFLHCAVIVTGVEGETHTATANFGRNSVRAQMTSHTYHHYFPGLSQQAIMTVALSDEGKAGVMREWGYFDGEYDDDITDPAATNELVEGNGFFFRVNGTNGLEFVIRSFATGVVTERIMRRDQTIVTSNGVVQSTSLEGWNGDRVDGTGDSGKIFSLVNDNIYWLDIQWLGAGRVRFGTYHQGQRITIHEYYHDNNGGVPTTQTGSLPIRYCQHQMKNVAVTGASSMNMWCAAVYTEADIDTSVLGNGRTEYFKAIIDPRNMNDVQGLRDTTMGDRKITTKTGITSSGSVLTVPNLTGIKPGWIVKVASGTGVVQSETRVSDVINSTTIQVDKAPTTAIISGDSVTFEMPVNDEYYLIGVLAPQPQIKNVNHTNRTLHLPRSVRAYAYWENGDPVEMSLQVYVNPVISGHNRVSNLYNTAEAAALGVAPVFIPVEANDPGNSVMAYGKAGIDTVNVFRDSGIHALVTYTGGYTGQEDLSGAFTSLQSAFKNLADKGGNNRCPILKVFQSPSAGRATAVQINTPPTGVGYSLHREGNAIQFEQIPGLIGTNSTLGLNRDTVTSPIFYLRMIDNDKAELYLDKNFQTPWDTSGLDNSSNGGSLTWPGNTGSVATGGFILSGYGPEVYFCVFAKPQGSSKGDSPFYKSPNGEKGKIEVNFSIYWNEIRQ